MSKFFKNKTVDKGTGAYAPSQKIKYLNDFHNITIEVLLILATYKSGYRFKIFLKKAR